MVNFELIGYKYFEAESGRAECYERFTCLHYYNNDYFIKYDEHSIHIMCYIITILFVFSGLLFFVLIFFCVLIFRKLFWN